MMLLIPRHPNESLCYHHFLVVLATKSKIKMKITNLTAKSKPKNSIEWCWQSLCLFLLKSGSLMYMNDSISEFHLNSKQ